MDASSPLKGAAAGQIREVVNEAQVQWEKERSALLFHATVAEVQLADLQRKNAALRKVMTATGQSSMKDLDKDKKGQVKHSRLLCRRPVASKYSLSGGTMSGESGENVPFNGSVSVSSTMESEGIKGAADALVGAIREVASREGLD
eukprot:Clim_evm2s169 gene=Clim_evmTU2s169